MTRTLNILIFLAIFAFAGIEYGSMPLTAANHLFSVFETQALAEEDADEDDFKEEYDEEEIEELFDDGGEYEDEEDLSYKPEEGQEPDDLAEEAHEEEVLDKEDKKYEEKNFRKPKPKKVVEKKKKARKVKQAGMRTLSKNCNMRKKASLKSQRIKTVNKGKKMWVEPHGDDWVKVYRKSGMAFISDQCF